MEKFRNKGVVLFLSILMVFSVSSCDIFDLDVNTDPNNPSQASLNLLFTNAIVSASTTFMADLNDSAMGFVSLTASNDDHNMTYSDWNTQWNALYEGPLNDLDRIIVAAKEAGNQPKQLGAAQVLKSYYFALMVDLWGDVPYFEAFQGDQGIKTPKFDASNEIYVDLLTTLDDAIANLGATSAAGIGGDLIYGGVAAKWIKAANSLKLKLLLTSSYADGTAKDIGSKEKLVALIAAHASQPIFITNPADDFMFRFAKTQNPDNRHPMYQDGYAGGEAAYTYFGSKFMAEMLANRDPRTPFYFKRQTDAVLNLEDPAQKQTAPCSQRDDCVYGYFPKSNYVSNLVFGKPEADLTNDERDYLAGYFGRDRSDPSGVPNDNPIRTTVGAYPAGGLFDDVAEAGGNNQGSGDGIFPMVTSWMVKFYLIEAQLKMGAASGISNEDLLKSALTDQFARVFSIGLSADPDAIGDVKEWENEYDWPVKYMETVPYINKVVADYGTYSGDKLQFVLKQAWFANFGNGFEIYTAFRRTGFPGDLQEPLEVPRQFALRIPYAQSEVNLNSNTPLLNYDAPENALFWDIVKYQF